MFLIRYVFTLTTEAVRLMPACSKLVVLPAVHICGHPSHHTAMQHHLDARLQKLAHSAQGLLITLNYESVLDIAESRGLS